MQSRKGLALAWFIVVAGLSGCVSVPKSPPPAPPEPVAAAVEFPAPPSPASPSPPAVPSPVAPASPAVPVAPVAEPALVPQPPPVPATTPALSAASWSALPEWERDDPSEAFAALLQSCVALKSQPEWRVVCADAAALRQDDTAVVRQFFENGFTPYAVRNADGSDSGLVTGYYEPLLRGSLTPDKTYRYPVYAVPEDLLVVDLAELHPDLKGVRLRGRLQGRKVVPYYTRAEIERGDAAVRGRELLWVDDAVELFFLQIQGSGRVRLPGGETIRLGFAEHNGHPYKSIGRLLIERGELTLDKASMQGIRQWGRQNPDKLPQLLRENPAYVFFRRLPDAAPGPIGALGVALTAGRSLAIDPAWLPLGAPVFLSATWPLSTRPLNRLMLAQDTGTAIKGAVRADFFWGFGEEAGQLAGRMRQSGRMWVLYPKGFKPRLP